MTDQPIIFSGPMVLALLDGRKTQTRRALKPQPSGRNARLDPNVTNNGRPSIVSKIFAGAEYMASPYAPGDRLWVREAWRSLSYLDEMSPSAMAAQAEGAGYERPWAPIEYRADSARQNWIADPHTFGTEPGRRRSAIDLPRWASRLTLIVTDVRIERVQDISNEAATAEGCPGVYSPQHPDHGCTDGQEPWQEFQDLWNSINGKSAWAANPWVAAITFTVHHRNIDTMEKGNE